MMREKERKMLERERDLEVRDIEMLERKRGEIN